MDESRISMDNMNASELAISVGLTAVGGIVAYFLPRLISVPTKDLPKSSDDIVEEEADTRGTNSKDLEAELENDVEAGEEEEGEGYKFDADRNLTASKIQFGSDHPNIGEEPSIHHEGIDQKKKRQGVYSQYREDASHSSQIISVQIVGGARVGKSTIAEAFVKGSIQRQVKSSYGANLFFKSLNIEGRKVYLQVWEIGETKPDTTNSRSHPQNRATILVYSVDDEKSVAAMKEWWSCLSSQADNSKQQDIIAVIGNRKVDIQGYEADSPMARHGLSHYNIKDNSNSIAEAEEFCEANGIPHFLLSSSNDVKIISQAFDFVMRKALQLS